MSITVNIVTARPQYGSRDELVGASYSYGCVDASVAEAMVAESHVEGFSDDRNTSVLPVTVAELPAARVARQTELDRAAFAAWIAANPNSLPF